MILGRISALPDQQAAALYGVAAKVANGVNWLIVAAAVWTHMTIATQGYFFSFLSLVTVQMLFDLGLGMAIVQFAAHEWAHVIGPRHPDDASVAAERLASVVRLAIRWYLVAAIIFFGALQVIGIVVFKNSPNHDWVGAWLFLTVLVSLDLATTGIWSVLEGCGRVRNVYLYRSLKAVVLGGVVWLAILGGAGLYSLGWGYFAVLPLTLGMLGGANATLLRRLLAMPQGRRVAWAAEVAPLQWRLAVSSVSAYFAQWGITPITFRLFSPVVAGQFGMVWSIINAVSAVSNVIMTVQASRFGALIASERYKELDRVALRFGVASILVAWLGFGTASLGLFVLHWIKSPLLDRVLPLSASLVMFAASALFAVLNPLAVYLRSHKREPYLGLSLGFSVGVLAATIVGAGAGDPLGVAVAYFLLVACFLLPAGFWIFVRCRRDWHNPLRVTPQ